MCSIGSLVAWVDGVSSSVPDRAGGSHNPHEDNIDTSEKLLRELASNWTGTTPTPDGQNWREHTETAGVVEPPVSQVATEGQRAHDALKIEAWGWRAGDPAEG